MATLTQPAEIASTDQFDVLRVSWDALEGVRGEGLLLQPQKVLANVVVIPDASQSPEAVVNASSYACRLAASGCRVVIPRVVSRQTSKQRAELTNREYLYRSAFEVGRHMIGYELQKIAAALDWFETHSADEQVPMGVIGWGEGGLLALYASAVDTRIDVCCSSGYFGPRNEIWQEPIDRNLFGLLAEFGDAELATLIAPRSLIIETGNGPEAEIRTPRGAPYRR